MLQAAIDAEVDAFIETHQHRRDEEGRRLVVKNGILPIREILTGAGAIPVRQRRVRDNAPAAADRVQFSPCTGPHERLAVAPTQPLAAHTDPAGQQLPLPSSVLGAQQTPPAAVQQALLFVPKASAQAKCEARHGMEAVAAAAAMNMIVAIDTCSVRSAATANCYALTGHRP